MPRSDGNLPCSGGNQQTTISHVAGMENPTTRSHTPPCDSYEPGDTSEASLRRQRDEIRTFTRRHQYIQRPTSRALPWPRDLSDLPGLA